MDHYEVCLLGKNNNIVKTILFNGKDDDKPISKNKIHSKQVIHLDDSIRIIKNKILKELGLTTVSYKELYLFSKCRLQDSLLDIYRFLTNQDTELLTADKFSNFLANIEKTGLLEKLGKKETFSYDDVMSVFEGTTDIYIDIPLGQKMDKKDYYFFVSNPYNFKNTAHTSTSFYIVENTLLLNYSNLLKNTIYVCLAEDVLEHATTHDYDTEYIVEYYFPFLYKDNINNVSRLIEEKQRLIEETNSNIFGSLNTLNNRRSFYTAEYKDNYAGTIQIKVYDTSGNVSLVTTLLKAYPTSMNDVSLNWSDNNNLIKLTITITFREWVLGDSQQAVTLNN